MKVLFRTDGGAAIGIGHLMRCLALAQALRDGGDSCALLTAVDPGSLESDWKREATVLDRIQAEVGSAEDLRATTEAIDAVRPNWLVLDGYQFDRDYIAAVGARTLLLLMDDHGGPTGGAALVLNPNLYAERTMYTAANAALLLGPRYAPLRREFVRRRRAEEPEWDVVVSLGGADPDRRTLPLIEAFARLGLKGRVVLGPHHQDRDELRRAAPMAGWDIAEAPADMAAVLAAARVAVVGAGTTTLECLALGVPMVAVRIAANQDLVVRALQASDLADVVDGRESPQRVAEVVTDLLRDSQRLRRRREAGLALVDGRGATRVAGAMRQELLTFRRAASGDGARLLEWRNDPVTRAASFSTNVVTASEHRVWLRRTLASPDVAMEIASLDAEPVGVVRVAQAHTAGVVSITVAPAARGRHLSVGLIRRAITIARERGLTRLDAFIRGSNEASQRAFAEAGFVEVRREDDDGLPPNAVRMVADLTDDR
ncbi:MAG TPA: UDP-2,4-diacetamido-2,4,6-trideoxy-beta-L-altropyranose hydrolase [candidate division Zixibacteria bacterium]|nr:UDP-2,4-diacetamido-2,4,6-trideoxy-beta-L-altropyranose hydrolase [candidate division Zixibacteria bacterium]